MGGARRLGGSMPGKGGVGPAPGKEGSILGGRPGKLGAIPG